MEFCGSGIHGSVVPLGLKGSKFTQIDGWDFLVLMRSKVTGFFSTFFPWRSCFFSKHLKNYTHAISHGSNVNFSMFHYTKSIWTFVCCVSQIYWGYTKRFEGWLKWVDELQVAFRKISSCFLKAVSFLGQKTQHGFRGSDESVCVCGHKMTSCTW